MFLSFDCVYFSGKGMDWSGFYCIALAFCWAISTVSTRLVSTPSL